MAIDPLTGQQVFDPREQLAQTLLGQGLQGGPVETPLQGVGRLAQALIGAKLQRDFQTEQRENTKVQMEGLRDALGGAAEEGTPQAKLLSAALSSPQAFRALGNTALSATFAPAGDASTRAFEASIANLSPEEQDKARRIRLGLAPRAVGSSALTTAQTGATDQVAESEATIEGAKAGAKESAKLGEQLKLRPKIEADIAQARKQAEAKGEAFTDFSRAQAALPGLQEVVNKLKSLADLSTYTLAGRAFDTVVKELGFGATEGATARAKMESLVNNQILPLLRDTFGAQFTEREGESLRKTMLDINASPEQKKEILDTFLEQKIRNLQTSEREFQALGGQQESGAGGVQFLGFE